MALLRLFAQAREAAGAASVPITGTTVRQVLDDARGRFGDPFARVLDTSSVWVNGEPADPDTSVGEADEIAVLPPVSGGVW